MANFALNNQTFAGDRALRADSAVAYGGQDAPVAPGRAGLMTVGGTLARSFALLLVLGAAGYGGWSAVDRSGPGHPATPGWAWPTLGAAVVLVVLTLVVPRAAVGTAVLLAGLEGALFGVASAVTYDRWDGIVVHLIGLVVAVHLFGVLLHSARSVRSAPTAQMVVALVVLALAGVSLVDFVVHRVGGDVTYMSRTGPFGVVVTLAVVAAAAANFVVDLRVVQEGALVAAPRWKEWYGAFGLLLTLVLLPEVLVTLVRGRTR